MQNSPIGIFDSGVGGLTVVRSLINRLPGESFIYFGDTAHVPYGNKTKEQLFSYARSIISFLVKEEVKAIIVACGTHSSVTLPALEKEYSLPLLGVVKPGARAAIKVSHNGRIGILATQATVNSQAYLQEIKALDPNSEVFQCACSRFVPLIEAGQLDGDEVRRAVQEYITPLLEQGVDTLVLGCTHYPFLTPIIADLAGPRVQLVDPAEETINEMIAIMDKSGMQANSVSPERQFLVSGQDDSFYTVGRLLLGDIISDVKKHSI